MAQDIKLIVQAILSDKDFKKGTESMKKGFKSGGKAAEKLKGIMKKVGTSFLVVGAAAAAAMAGLIKGAVSAASRFEEANAKFETVFRGVTSQANEMRKELVEAYGLSRIEATKFLSSVQDLFVPLGFARDKAAEMAGSVVKLTRDLASFNNLPTEQVMMDIQSALVGNFETMKKYGVILNEGVIKQEALDRGMKLVNGRVSAQDKALIALELSYRGSADAVGDYQRTSDSFANTIVTLRARFEDMKTELGEGLLPVLSQFAVKLIEVVEAVNMLIVARKRGTEAGQLEMQFIMTSLAPTYKILKVETIAWADALIKAEKELERVRATQSRFTGESRDATLGLRAMKRSVETWIKTNELGFSSAEDFLKSYKTSLAEVADEEKVRGEAAADAAAVIVEKAVLTDKQIKAIRKDLRDFNKKWFEESTEDYIKHLESRLELLREHGELIIENETELKTQIDALEEGIRLKMVESWMERIDLTKEYLTAFGSISDSLMAIETNRLAKIEKAAEESFDSRSTIARAYRDDQAKQEADRLANMDDAEKQSYLIKKQYEEEKATAVAESTKAQREKMTQLAKFAREVDIAIAIADAAVAVLKTMASVPYPANIPLAILQGAAGALQVKKIESTPLPSFAKGIEALSRDMPISAHKDERIIPADLNIRGMSNEALMTSAMRGISIPSPAPSGAVDNSRSSTLTDNRQSIFNVPQGTLGIDEVLAFARRTNSPILRR